MKQALQQVLEQVRSHRPAQLTLTTEQGTYTRRFQPRERLILLGGGHVAQNLCPLAARLGFSVTVVDDRTAFATASRFPEAEAVLCEDFARAIEYLSPGPGDYAAVMTRGHRSDGDCLRALLSRREYPGYVGMVASRSRGADLLAQLRGEGFDAARLEAIRTPIGLPIQALTLPEIAVSIAAELVQVRRAETLRGSGSAVLTQTEPELPVLEFALDDPAPKALLVVLETVGSTPVKTGAILVTDRSLRIAGTIGGGCAEHALVRRASGLIGTGGQQVFHIAMDGRDVHGREMSCGGEMTVLAADLG